MLAAPFIAAFGVADGMRVLGLMMAAAGALLCRWVLRIAGLGVIAAAAGQIAYLLTPLGWWALQALGEGLVSVCVLGAVAGVLLLRRLRGPAGAALLIGSLAALGFTRYSTLLIAATALALVCGLLLAIDAANRHRWAVTAIVVNGAAAVVTAAVIPLFGLPSATTTLQDTFTNHFAEPSVAHPWQDLVVLNRRFWSAWIGQQWAAPVFLMLVIGGLVALLLWRRELFWLALALFGVGVAQIVAHPLAQEAARLGIFMWMPVVFGVAALVDRLNRFAQTWVVGRRSPAPLSAG